MRSVPCDCCHNPTAAYLLYPFNCMGEVGFRCNICVDTENDLIEAFGRKRDDINNELDIRGPYQPNQHSVGLRKQYLHVRVFPENDEGILPEKVDHVATVQRDFLDSGFMTQDQYNSMMTFVTSYMDYFNDGEKTEPLTYNKAMELLTRAFDVGEVS